MSNQEVRVRIKGVSPEALIRLLLLLAMLMTAAVVLAQPASAAGGDKDELFFYREDGTYAYYEVRADGSLKTKVTSGTGYSKGWSTITAVDLDGDGTDEMFFYREIGTYAFYDLRADGALSIKLSGGTAYSKGWSTITAVDLDGGNDELFFYREDGSYAFYKVRADGTLKTKLIGGTGYSKGWSTITAVDLDGDGRDELFFYREDGSYAFYDVRADGTLKTKLIGGTGYSKGWSTITGVDLDGDGTDELFFYREDGSYAFYDVRTDGTLRSKLTGGTGYSKGWSSIAGVNVADIEGTVITGRTCPGMVHGVATLAGNVSLTCDLMVMGPKAVLRARPGVNVTGNGFQIMFMQGGRADFQGTKVATWSNDGKAQNRSRDIVFRGMKRIMFHQGAGPSTLKYFSVIDSGTNLKGDYPIHFHLNGNTTRGTIVEGVVVINGRHHAFVPHGSHGITFKDTIAYNTRGDAYWWDPDAVAGDRSTGIVYDHALADGVSTGPGDENGFRLSGFALRDGKGNVVRNSAAINIKPVNVKDCSGFHWPEDAESVWVFTNNFSSSPSGCHGIFTWQNDEASHVINGFRGGGIDHGAYANKYSYRNVVVPYFEIHAGGFTITGGQVNTLIAMEHATVTPQNPTVTITNTRIGKFVINNGDGDRYGVYVLNGTGLTCSGVVRQSVFPGTRVIIDGRTC